VRKAAAVTSLTRSMAMGAGEGHEGDGDADESHALSAEQLRQVRTLHCPCKCNVACVSLPDAAARWSGVRSTYWNRGRGV
jgi:hypothetical protein